MGTHNQQAAAQSEFALSCTGFISFPLPGTQGQATAEDAEEIDHKSQRRPFSSF